LQLRVGATNILIEQTIGGLSGTKWLETYN